MEMKVDTQRIKTERARRAWSQEHLAHAAGLGLRTIHRIENSGRASLESVKALAAVLELKIDDLRIEAETVGESPRFAIHDQAMFWLANLYAWMTAVYFGAVVLDIIYANLLRSSQPAEITTVLFSEVSDSLLFLLMLVVLSGMAALILTWNMVEVRFRLLASLLIFFFSPFLLHVPIPFQEYSLLGPAVRLLSRGLSFYLAFAGLWRLTRDKPSNLSPA